MTRSYARYTDFPCTFAETFTLPQLYAPSNASYSLEHSLTVYFRGIIPQSQHVPPGMFSNIMRKLTTHNISLKSEVLRMVAFTWTKFSMGRHFYFSPETGRYLPLFAGWNAGL
jgi:hypothetical protein